LGNAARTGVHRDGAQIDETFAAFVGLARIKVIGEVQENHIQLIRSIGVGQRQGSQLGMLFHRNQRPLNDIVDVISNDFRQALPTI
jgi:hypothetical protein